MCIIVWFYEYNIKDHLGNVRVSFKSNSGVLQQVESTNYDPVGIELNGTGTANSVENRFKYQDKESLTLFGLSGINDFGARYYDKTVGRWWGVDALADVSRRHSPYQYNYNNPLRYIDPDGMASEEMVGADGLTNSQWLAAGGDAGKEKTFNQENKKEEKSTQKNTIQIYNRDDGGQNSKLFSNETEAYRYMWAIALLKKWGIRGREVGAILTNKGVLVTPYANNEYADSGSGFLEAGLKKNNDYISFEGGQLFMLGVIHTHQALSLDGSPWALGYKLSGEDKDFAYKMIPGKPIFAIGRDGNLYGYAWANYGKKIMKGDEGFWTGHNTAELFDGSFRLIPSLKQIFNKP
ncbi:RHS repeat domain-containing protein [Flectobacillus major]|uniref:RHS repeat domain-containing protein n=1 Tax=Flectobacillus major TaxID=103 RepID=UPI0003FF8F39|nr:RHS repeat-associated core domain-containing protein [Flectobacillus major]